MSAGKYQRFSYTVKTQSGELLQHDFIAKSRHATDGAAMAIVPRLAEVLGVNMAELTETQIEASVRNVKNCLTAYDSMRIVDGAPWIDLKGAGCYAMLARGTTHFCGFDPYISE